MIRQLQGYLEFVDIPRPLAIRNGLILLLVFATVFPILRPPDGILLSFASIILACLIVGMRPELGRRWYLLASLPAILWGYAAFRLIFVM